MSSPRSITLHSTDGDHVSDGGVIFPPSFSKWKQGHP